MQEFFFAYGYITNLAVIILVGGWLIVGFILGYVAGSERAERRAFERESRDREYWRSYYSHPSNR